MTVEEGINFISKFNELGVKAMIRIFWQDEEIFCIAVYDREYSDVHPVFSFATNRDSFESIKRLMYGGGHITIPGLNRKELELGILTGEHPFWAGKL